LTFLLFLRTCKHVSVLGEQLFFIVCCAIDCSFGAEDGNNSSSDVAKTTVTLFRDFKFAVLNAFELCLLCVFSIVISGEKNVTSQFFPIQVVRSTIDLQPRIASSCRNQDTSHRTSTFEEDASRLVFVYQPSSSCVLDADEQDQNSPVLLHR
jgi:hypothetical protein